MSDRIVARMKEYGLKVEVLAPDEQPLPESKALGDMVVRTLSNEDRIAELELRIGHLGNALEGAESDCVTLSAEVDRLRSLAGRLQKDIRQHIDDTLGDAASHVRLSPYLREGDLDSLEDV